MLKTTTAILSKLKDTVPKRNFWQFVNKKFNEVDEERRKLYGPDRACAEWVLRNGGKIRWTTGETVINYNTLPPPETAACKVAEIDATESGISHYGFPHLAGCKHLKRIILHNCPYIDDQAMLGLSAYATDYLEHLQVSECPNVTEQGVRDLCMLRKLRTLTLFNLVNVPNLKACIHELEGFLPGCKIEGT